jgi:hypothetical protein
MVVSAAAWQPMHDVHDLHTLNAEMPGIPGTERRGEVGHKAAPLKPQSPYDDEEALKAHLLR